MHNQLIAWRRDFHQHPEIAFQEVRTAGIVAETLVQLGLEVQSGVGQTGVVAILEGHHDGPTVLVRCDMDALPIEEENEVPYRSQTARTMHACGHDGHTAIALGVAHMLHQQRAALRGRVKFVFQPAEEIAAGAQAMLQAGVLENPRPDVSLGLHLWNLMPVGKIGLAAGPLMAGSAIFTVELEGRGGHAAAPHQTADPVVAAAHLITALQTLASRNVSPLETAVISVTQVMAGDAHNVIPSRATLKGTIRFFKPEVRELIGQRFEQVVQGVAGGLGCAAQVNIKDLTIPVVNDAAVVERLRQGFTTFAPEHEYLSADIQTMGGEDMAFFLEQVPGVFFFVGSSNAERDLHYAHHHPRFDFDERALVIGAALLASAVSDYVLPA
ncbi:MAG: amidohydrolase [Anaerolineae bacterium]|nr:amidohydrolase [Anaerolineae bacterium]